MMGFRRFVLAFVASLLIASPTVKADDPPSKKTAVKRVSILTALFGGGGEVEEAKTPPAESAFTQAKAVSVSSPTGKLVAIARGPEDTVVAIAGPARGVGRVATSKKSASAEVHVYSGEGKLVRKWTVPFAASAAATTPSGEIIIAGDGKIAKFDAQGKEIACVDAPHVANLLKDTDAIKKKAEERKKSMVQLYEQQVTQLNKQLESLAKRDKESNGGGNASTRQRNQYDSMLKMYQQQVKQLNDRPIESFITELTGQVKTVNAVAASKEFIFLTCGEAKGYGYTVWRMGTDFSNPKTVLTGLSGCCGQMDVQCCEDCLLVAENTRKRVGVYSFEGKQLRTFGKDGRDSVGEGFGGCCNPMNTFPADNGSVLTAESEGYIKRFDRNGKFVELIAQAKLSGGCKNVAVASSQDGKRIFLMDLPGSKLLIFEKKGAASIAAN